MNDSFIKKENHESDHCNKSQSKSVSTLLNTNQKIHFIYKITDYKADEIEIARINNIETKSKIKDRLSEIKKAGGQLQYVDLEQGIFKNNLVLIDSLLPDILSEIVKTFYETNHTTITDLTNHINNKNPLQYDKQFAHSFYEYKIKRFLSDVALGMMPSKVWSGIFDATGGYLIVKKDGEIVSYNIYNKNEFEAYLFTATKLETASSTRHGFGDIFKQGNDYFIKLNLQIRFYK